MKIEAIICETVIPNASMVCVRIADGSYAELLFDSEGEPIPLNSPIAIEIATAYSKTFTTINT